MSNSYPTKPLLDKGELPDPFAKTDGGRVASKREWNNQAQAWRDLIINMEYGGLPPKPESMEFEELCHGRLLREDGPHMWSYKIHCNGGQKPFSLSARIVFPDGPGPFPAVISGDGCAWYLSDAIAKDFLGAGCAVVMFNRTETAEDLGYTGVPDKFKRNGGLYDVYPSLGFGALSAWAWGYHRCVDLLQKLSFIDKERIAITGHSRGGKTTLIAGATDDRITLVNDNASCAGGSAAFRYVGDAGETLEIVNVYPSWFGKHGLRPYLNKEEDIPFDQHCLLATIAPRQLLLTYALDDRWSNPEGMVLCATAAKEVFRFLDAENNLAFHLRAGTHSHTPEDWEVLLDFIKWKWMGQEPMAPYNQHPYNHLKPAHSWAAPRC